uniref:Deoxyribonuclease II n=1 Tax=Rhipicephalus zambeziensis TaxID=60191 RepID=A0A224YWZ2_9ACAR
MAYYDINSHSNRWELLSGDIYGTRNNPVYETLRPIYQHQSAVAYAAYNDQLPDYLKGTRKGHTKGVLMAGKGHNDGTVWLQHSVPRFVDDLKKEYTFPESGRENGQLFLCISFRLDVVNIIAHHLHVQAANVYQTNYRNWTDRFPYFWRLLRKDYIRNPKYFMISLLHTRTKKRRVFAMAKPPFLRTDIYTQELRHKMDDDIVVQSWKNGAGEAQHQFCQRNYSVTDVMTVSIKTKAGRLYFSSREDHSKWYVTRKKALFCFSSLNRMKSQWSRGGEITCLLDTRPATLFRNSIANSTSCTMNKRE